MPKRGHTSGGAGRRRGSQGGAKRRKNYIDIDFSNFADFADKLDRMGADLQKVFGDAMERAAETVQNDVHNAVQAANLPAGGKYSDGQTDASVIDDVSVKWSGMVGEVGLGFDKTKPGAGGFLTTGTPFMQPDDALADLFMSKRYARTINDQITEDLQKALDDLGR